MGRALLVIDVQNDYFPGGAYPQWHAEQVLEKIEKVIKKAKEQKVPVILIQHLSKDTENQTAVFKQGTKGAKIHPRILKAAPKAVIISKTFADSFYQTNLEEILAELNASEVFVCGIMTQNCVTHTVLSQVADKYTMKLIPDCCTSVDPTIHMMALKALSIRVPFISSEEVFKGEENID